MTIFKKIIFNLVFVGLTLLPQASYSFTFTSLFSSSEEIYEITDETLAYQHILKQISDLFNSQLQKQLCKVSNNLQFWEITLGLKKQDILNILTDNCKFEIDQSLIDSVKHKKKYFLLIDKSERYPFNSWTDFTNQTFLISKSGTIQSDLLYKMITHEIAISLDSKLGTNSYGFSSSDWQKILSNKEFKMSSAWDEIPTEQNTNSDNLLYIKSKKLIDWSTYRPIQFAFASLRAFNVEKLATKKEALITNDTSTCAEDFLSMFHYFENLKIKSDVESFENGLHIMADIKSNQMLSKTKNEIDKILKIILNEDLLFPADSMSSFCIFMTTPQFSNVNLMTTGFGPRPRFGGGAHEINDLSGVTHNNIHAGANQLVFLTSDMKKINNNPTIELFRYKK